MNRLDLIKNAVKNVNSKKAAIRKANQKFVKDCERKIARLKAKAEREALKQLEALDEDYNQVDAKTAKVIADSAVGEIYRETVKFDNEWN